MNPSAPAFPDDPHRHPSGRTQPPTVVVVDAEAAPRLSDYRDILLDHRWSILAVVALSLAIGAIYATLATPVHRGNLLIQIEESQPDGRMFLSETSGLFEVKTPATGEIQVLGSRLVLGAAVDQAGLRVAARPEHLPVVGAWLSTLATGLSTPGLLGHGGYVTGTERIDVARFSVPAPLEDTAPFTVTAGVDGRYTVRHPGLGAVREGTVGVPLRGESPAGPFDLLIDRLDGRPGAGFKVSVASRLAAIEQLQARLQINEQGRQSNVIAVVLEDTDHARLVTALAAIGDRYVMQNVERKSAEAQKTLAFLDAQLPVFERQLRGSEDALAEFRNRNGTASFDEETRVWLRRTSELQSGLLELQQRRREAEAHFTPQSPRVATLERQIGAVQGELGALNARIAGMPRVQRDALRLERDVKVNGDLYQSMQNNALQMRLVREGRIGNVRLLDRADVPDAPVRPQKLLILAFALLLGLVAGPGLAIARERGRPGLRTPDEVEAVTGLEVCAVLPHSPRQASLDRHAGERAGPDGGNDRLLADVHPHDAAIEALRSLRATLRAPLARGSCNRILIAGATPGTGKRFIACNFAQVLAQSGRRVLFVDADLRPGDDGRFAFGIGASAGLSEVLAGGVADTQAIHVDVRPGLDVLATGRLPDFPAELLDSDAFVRVLDACSSRYDLVVIDTAPVLVAADAASVARACGVVLLTARAGQARPGELNESVRRLRQAGVAVDGLLFNGIDLARRYRGRDLHRHRRRGGFPAQAG